MRTEGVFDDDSKHFDMILKIKNIDEPFLTIVPNLKAIT
jgi:hypothetical protein